MESRLDNNYISQESDNIYWFTSYVAIVTWEGMLQLYLLCGGGGVVGLESVRCDWFAALWKETIS